jgi:hypothetical protein
MARSNPLFTETPDGLWISADGAGRFGCILVLAVLGLIPGIVVGLNSGSWLDGAKWVGVALLIAALLLSLPYSLGLAVTSDAVRLHRLSLLGKEVFELPRKDWIELWIDEESEQAFKLYLYVRSPDPRKTAYAIPLLEGPPKDVVAGADRVGQLLGLPQTIMLLAPKIPPESIGAAVNEARARGRRAQAQIEAAAADPDSDTSDVKSVARKVRKVMSVLHMSLKALETPEAWLITPERAMLTYQAPGGDRTEYRFDEVAAVDVQPEKEGEAGGDSSAPYVFVYRVYLIMTNGEYFMVRRCTSCEAKKKGESQSRRDAEKQARCLRRMVGLPDK